MSISCNPHSFIYSCFTFLSKTNSQSAYSLLPPLPLRAFFYFFKFFYYYYYIYIIYKHTFIYFNEKKKEQIFLFGTRCLQFHDFILFIPFRFLSVYECLFVMTSRASDTLFFIVFFCFFFFYSFIINATKSFTVLKILKQFCKFPYIIVFILVVSSLIFT